jgi:hypothetical protein
MRLLATFLSKTNLHPLLYIYDTIAGLLYRSVGEKCNLPLILETEIFGVVAGWIRANDMTHTIAYRLD